MLMINVFTQSPIEQNMTWMAARRTNNIMHPYEK